MAAENIYPRWKPGQKKKSLSVSSVLKCVAGCWYCQPRSFVVKRECVCAKNVFTKHNKARQFTAPFSERYCVSRRNPAFRHSLCLLSTCPAHRLARQHRCVVAICVMNTFHENIHTQSCSALYEMLRVRQLC